MVRTAALGEHTVAEKVLILKVHLYKLSFISHSSWRSVTRLTLKLSITLLARQPDHMDAIAHNPLRRWQRSERKRNFWTNEDFKIDYFCSPTWQSWTSTPFRPFHFPATRIFCPILKAFPAPKTLWPGLANWPMNVKIYWERMGILAVRIALQLCKS
jgi:hypothetical protein